MADETETAAAEPQSADLKDGTPSIGEVADVLGLTAPEAETEENSEPTEKETQPVEPQPETEPEPAPEPEPEPPQENRTQAKIDARIGKEVAKRKELEEQVESERATNRDLARQLEEVQAGSRKEALSLDDPVANMKPADLDKMEHEQRDMKKWAVQNWDGYSSDEEEGEDFDAEQVRALYNSSVDNLEVKIPAARQKIAVSNELQSQAVGKYPFLVDKNAPEFPHAAQIYNSEAYRQAYHADPANALEMLGQAALARAQGLKSEQRNTPTPPSIPTDASPAGPSTVSEAKPKQDGLPIDEFVQAGGSHDALVQLIQQTI